MFLGLCPPKHARTRGRENNERNAASGAYVLGSYVSGTRHYVGHQTVVGSSKVETEIPQ